MGQLFLILNKILANKMHPKKTKPPLIIPNITLTHMATEGKAIGKTPEGKVIFVENGLPHDIADIRIFEQKKDYAVGKIHQLHQASPYRIDPFCTHFGVCGGCKWQYLQYSQQAIYKQEMVLNALTHIGKLNIPPIMPIIQANPNTFYRNKLEFTFANKKWQYQLPEAQNTEPNTTEPNTNALGFHVPRFFDKVVDIQKCYLQNDFSNTLRNTLRTYAFEHNLTFYDLKKHEGFLRNLIIRTASFTNETMVILSVAQNNEAELMPLMQFLKEKFENQITSLHYAINPKLNDTLFDIDIITYYGRGYIYEKLGNCMYKISPKSFFQTNSYQAQNLYKVVQEFAGLEPHHTLYDLYTGTGSIALYLAHQCAQVIGIEEVQAAIDDANFNTQLNGISNAHFYAGDVKKLLTNELVQKHGQPHVLITDPPRAGMHTAVIDTLLAIAPQKIVYVSCNPSTQARDLQLLTQTDLYSIQKIQPVDMFPHTFHIENVVLLEKN